MPRGGLLCEKLPALNFYPGAASIGLASPRRKRPMTPLSLRAACAALLLLIVNGRPASSEVPEGTWMLANRVAVQVFECSGLVCGRIVWLVRPRTPDGQPDTDHLNPDPTLRQRPLCGPTII